MCIEVSFSLNQEESSQIDGLFAACRKKDSLPFSSLIPCEPKDLTVFFYRENGRLLSLLETAPFSPDTWELRAFTHPDARRRGYLRRLFSFMAARLFADGLPEFFFYAGENSEDTKGFVRRFACQKLDTDHLLSLTPPWPAPQNKFSAVPCQSSDKLAGIHADIFGWPVAESGQYLAENLEDPGRLAFLLEKTGRPAGCFLLTFFSETACLSGFGLRPAFRGKGFAAPALNAVLNSLPSSCQRLDVQVSESNKPAYHLYRKAGFISRSALTSYRFSGFLS
ncbi:MAG: GNAT family N-acetyltransferase [Lachnospiraceae bacterium]|nr:GNAT family N-acetyltransferase [Lachnospiraceae bacterium]